MSGKKIAIIYKSLTGNTRQVAEAIRDALGGEEIVYFGEPKPDIVADLYFVGSWTDKGSCDGTIGEYLKQLAGKKLAVFGTAGYGGSREYYQKLNASVKNFDEALSHPDEKDFADAGQWAQTMVDAV